MTKSQKLALKISELRAKLHQKMRDYDAVKAPDALSAEPSPEGARRARRGAVDLHGRQGADAGRDQRSERHDHRE